MILTAGDIIKLALKDCGALGIGQSADAEDTSDAFDTLNMMLAQWSRKRWLVYHLVDKSIVSTGAVSYTIGPGGNINVPQRPDKLSSAFLRQLLNTVPNQIDYPIRIITAREDYNRIAFKQLPSFTQMLFYDAVYPIGVVYPYPLALASVYEYHFTFKDTLTEFPSLSTALNLPHEYYGALLYNLMVRLGVRYPISKDQLMAEQWNDVKGLAKDSLNVLRESNIGVAVLTMPSGLTKGSRYNIYSDSN